jgi:hypothetical protein
MFSTKISKIEEISDHNIDPRFDEQNEHNFLSEQY